MATGEKLVNLDSLKTVHDKLSGDVADLKSALKLTNEVDGSIIDLGQNWTVTRNHATVAKTHNNTFTFSGTHTGSYQYVILSSDNGTTFAQFSEMEQSDFTIKLIQGQHYKIVYEKLSETAIEDSNAWFYLMRMVNGEPSSVQEANVTTAEFADAAIIEKEFVADADSYAIVNNLRSLTYSGTFRMCLVDVSTDKEISALEEDIGLLKDEITFMEVFPKCKAIYASITDVTGLIKANNNCRTIYFDAQPNTVYIIKKPVGGRFTVGESTVLPAGGISVSYVVTDHTATQIMYKTSSEAKYVAVFCYFATTDVDITPAKMCQSVRVFLPNDHENIYEEKFELTPYTIYDTKNLPYYVYPKTYGGSLQSIAYHNGNIYVIMEGEIRIYAANGIPQTIDYADFAHPHYAEVYENTVLITSTDASDGRSVYSLDCGTLEITKLFSLPVNAISVSKLTETVYKVIAWGEQTNELAFYDYDSSTDTLTEIGNYTLDRNYYQGGSRINNIYYIMTNSGNGNADSAVHIVDGDTFTKIGQITIKGLGECEGFFVYVEGESMYAWFVSNTLDKLIKVKLL